jgi:hypothetical protein
MYVSGAKAILQNSNWVYPIETCFVGDMGRIAIFVASNRYQDLSDSGSDISHHAWQLTAISSVSYESEK